MIIIKNQQQLNITKKWVSIIEQSYNFFLEKQVKQPSITNKMYLNLILTKLNNLKNAVEEYENRILR